MAMHGYNSGIWHAVFKFGQPTLCKSRRAVMACEIADFRDDRTKCKRCAAKLAEMDARAAAKADAEKRVVGTIDITPTWAAVLPVYLEAYCNGTPSAQSAARSELARMAAIADATTN